MTRPTVQSQRYQETLNTQIKQCTQNWRPQTRLQVNPTAKIASYMGAGNLYILFGLRAAYQASHSQRSQYTLRSQCSHYLPSLFKEHFLPKPEVKRTIFFVFQLKREKNSMHFFEARVFEFSTCHATRLNSCFDSVSFPKRFRRRIAPCRRLSDSANSGQCRWLRWLSLGLQIQST